MADIMIIVDDPDAHEIFIRAHQIGAVQIIGLRSHVPPTPEPMPIAWLKEMDDWHLRKSFLTSLQARYAFPTPLPTTRSSYRPDRPVVRSLRSVNRNR